MNPKFFDVKKEKQDNIINAALKVFSQKGYKDASTDVIVKTAGISKGLLFHYFISKQGLYEFICDYSQKYMSLELTRTVKSTERDFFILATQIERARCRVKKHYPYMHSFLRSLAYEKDEDAVSAMGNSLAQMNNVYNNIFAQANKSRFIGSEDCEMVLKMLNWINDGLMKDEHNVGNTDQEDIFNKYIIYLEIMRRHFYKSEASDSLSIAKEEVVERDETIMNGMRLDMSFDMTFEERLEAGKKRAFDGVALELPKSMEQIREESRKKEEEEKKAASEEKALEEAKQQIKEEIKEGIIEDKEVKEIAPEKAAQSNQTYDEPSQSINEKVNENVNENASSASNPTSNIVPFMNTSVIMPVAHKVDLARNDKPKASIDEIIREAEGNLSKMEGDN